MAILAEGTLAITQTAIFALDRGTFRQKKNATVNKITFFNEVSAPQTAILSLRRGNTGDVRAIRQFILRQFNGGEYLEPGEFLELTNGDELLAETSNASSVNFVIVGERN